MSMTGVSSLDSSIHKTNEWLEEIRGNLKAEDSEDAYKAVRAVFHALRDRLTVDEATDLGAQLPNPLRGIYYAGWNPSENPVKLRHKEDFLSYVRDKLPEGSAVKPYAATRAVFEALGRHVSEGEIQDVIGIMNKELQELWPEKAARSS